MYRVGHISTRLEAPCFIDSYRPLDMVVVVRSCVSVNMDCLGYCRHYCLRYKHIRYRTVKQFNNGTVTFPALFTKHKPLYIIKRKRQ